MKPLHAAIASATILLAGMTALGGLAMRKLEHLSVHMAQHETAAHTAQSSAPQQDSRYYANNPRAMQLAERIAANSGLDLTWTQQAIGKARVSEAIRRLVLPPKPTGSQPKRKNWNAYRARFVEPARIRAGVQFRDAHHDALQRAQKQYGVPKEIIAGVLGMETLWGKQTGQIRVLDALVTLAVDFPSAHPRAAQRAAYFAEELEYFLRLMHDSGTDPREPRGSYAGDMGLPQFMPSSWARFGVDFNGDGHIDLWNAEDAIGSVANYLRGKGWLADLPVYYPVQMDASEAVVASLTATGLAPLHSAEKLRHLGITLMVSPSSAAPPDAQLALVELENRDQPSLWIAATGNLRALTRYNPSRYYAMAVTELGTAIATAPALSTEQPD
ncbi:MAG: lytic murein transglycosylase [Comamonas sp.]|uniref:lytic murein transglycosylase n=1 Tax=Comamonas sp. TaxID=34028 RepID=UPI0028184E64|nr:lytic murein transglycosylase [Comamonas sp.]MDR0213020.1 lytic murein transglycosylase [Comamonas sp.]